MTTATGRMTLGAILGAVTTTAGAVTGAIGTAASSIMLLDNYVGKALNEQKTRHVLESENFEERLLIELTQEQASLRLAADQFCNQSPAHQEHFNTSYAKLSAVLARHKGNKTENTLHAVA